MKKLSIVALVLVLMISLAACGRRDNNETSAPSTTAPSTGMDIIPDMEPIETNIPDPNVDNTMPMYTEGTNSTEDGNNGGMTGGNASGGMTGNSQGQGTGSN